MRRGHSTIFPVSSSFGNFHLCQGPKHPIGEHYFWDKWENCPLIFTRGWHAGMPIAFLRFHFGKSSINLFSQSDYIKGVFMTTSVTTVALNHFVVHRHQRSPGQLREHSRELWVKTQKSACRLIDLLYLFLSEPGVPGVWSMGSDVCHSNT